MATILCLSFSIMFQKEPHDIKEAQMPLCWVLKVEMTDA